MRARLQKLTSIGFEEVIFVPEAACDRVGDGESSVRTSDTTNTPDHAHLAAEKCT